MRRLFLGLLSILLWLPLSAPGAGDHPIDFALESARWGGDLDALLERRIIRALVVQNRMLYFLDRGRQRGISYELLTAFEKFINQKQKSRTLGIHIVFIPVSRDRLISDLIAGRGDIAVANLTITDERRKQVDFSQPVFSGVDEILVTGPTAPDIHSLELLSGQSIHVRPSSSYFEHLQRLNMRFQQQGLRPVELLPVKEYLEDSDLLEMVNAGSIPMLIVDSHKAQFWADVFENIKLHPDIAIHRNADIAWAFRRNSPKLKALVDEFISGHRKGTLFGNIVYKRYLRNNKWVRNNLDPTEMEKFERVVDLFRDYSERYDLDPLMMLALSYQESGLSHNKKSPAGAVGIMQMLPRTAADSNVGIPDISGIENNVHAGIKYLRFILDRYFSDTSIDPLNRVLLAIAAYNAGPARIARLRREAKSAGLNPNVWFRNVELIAAKRIGRETVQYVSNIFKYYTAYRMLLKGREEKHNQKAKLQGS